MSLFKCYLMDRANTIASVDSVEAENDAVAMRLAGDMILARHDRFAAIEVWERARCVGKISNFVPKRDLEPRLKN